MLLESTRADLLEIERAHREDHDGGYRLAAAFCEYRAQLQDDARDQWDEVLLQWVRDEERALWGVALEALSRAGGDRVNVVLSEMLRERRPNLEWRDYITHTLIRRRFADDGVRAEAENGARQMRPLGLPNLAALLVLLPELLGSAVDCVLAAMASGLYDYVEANIAPFAYAAADSDPELLVRLAAQAYEQDAVQGQKLAAMIIAYVSKPFVQKRFGSSVAARLVTALREATMS